MDYKSKLNEYLLATARHNASDLHLNVGRYPTMRVDGVLVTLSKEELITPEIAEGLVYALLSDEQKENYSRFKDLDFSYAFEDKARFRINVYRQRGFHTAALRLIPSNIRTVEELNLPSTLHEFTRYKQGFFILVGPAGMGKSTTLASLVDEINHKRFEHIITIEDPIEYMFVQDRCIIDQREIGSDAVNWHRALRAALREDPDVLMIGEMRDSETMATAITAAETGHLVFSTLHTNDASQTIDRIIDSFPSSQQGQIRFQIASTLIGIVSQRLIPRIEGGRIPATEIMITNAAVRNLIREDKVFQIPLIIETGVQEGMLSMNRSLAMLVRKREISLEHAQMYSMNVQELRLLL